MHCFILFSLQLDIEKADGVGVLALTCWYQKPACTSFDSPGLNFITNRQPILMTSVTGRHPRPSMTGATPIVARILVARHLKADDDLFDNKPSLRTESMVAAVVQGAKPDHEED